MAKQKITAGFVEHVYDVLHFVARTREVRVVTSSWYRRKFKKNVSDRTGSRAWERFKERLKTLRIPHDVEDVFESEECAVPTKGIKFTLPDAWDRISALVDRYCAGPDDEPRPDNRDNRADRGDHEVHRQGRPERDGDVPICPMASQQGSG